MSVELSYRNGRADLVLSRPEVHNAMDFEVFDGLAGAAAELATSKARVVVVSGSPPSFSSGIDTRALGAGLEDPDDLIRRAQAGFRALAALPMPTVASIRGHALGAGLQLALACDVRVCASDASLGLLEHGFALVPDLGGTQRLPALVGPGYAKLMIWTAERIDGAEAHRRGLVEIVVPRGDLDSVTEELAGRLAAAPTVAAAEVKRLVDLSSRVPLPEGMDEEAAAQKRIFATADFAEALTALMERREPQFRGV